jgi:hypothetical protein
MSCEEFALVLRVKENVYCFKLKGKRRVSSDTIDKEIHGLWRGYYNT